MVGVVEDARGVERNSVEAEDDQANEDRRAVCSQTDHHQGNQGDEE